MTGVTGLLVELDEDLAIAGGHEPLVTEPLLACPVSDKQYTAFVQYLLTPKHANDFHQLSKFAEVSPGSGSLCSCDFSPQAREQFGLG